MEKYSGLNKLIFRTAVCATFLTYGCGQKTNEISPISGVKYGLQDKSLALLTEETRNREKIFQLNDACEIDRGGRIEIYNIKPNQTAEGTYYAGTIEIKQIGQKELVDMFEDPQINMPVDIFQNFTPEYKNYLLRDMDPVKDSGQFIAGKWGPWCPDRAKIKIKFWQLEKP